MRGAKQPGVGPHRPVDAAKLGYLRCMLALVCVAVMWLLDAPLRPLELARASAVAYLVWAAAVVLASTRRQPLSQKWLPWVDIACYAWFIWVTEGAQSVFFLYFFFPIVVASFSHGLRDGLATTAVSAGALVALGLASGHGMDEIRFAQVLVSAAILLILGSLIAYWGGGEMRLKDELMLLQELHEIPNFRNGSQFMIPDALRRLREFYRADNCILMTDTEFAGGGDVYSCHGSRHSPLAARVSEPARSLLLGAPENLAIAYVENRGQRINRGVFAFDVRLGMRAAPVPAEWCGRIADFVEMPAFIAAPYAERSGRRGRLYVTAARAFSSADLALLVRVATALAALSDYIQLVENVVSAAAERERARLSLDLHDTTIQPYIGLRMGLEALSQEVDEDSAIKGPLCELVAMADLTIRDLRAYAANLRGRPRGDDSLLAAVTEQAARYERFYGMRVDVDIGKVAPPAHVAGEIFQIIVEGLSNIHRHTSANRAYVRVGRDARALMVEIGNEAADRVAPRFTPRSIQQRVAMLGGSVSVGAQDGYTRVSVSLPL